MIAYSKTGALILPNGGIVGDTMVTGAALTDKCWVFDLKNTEPGAVVLSLANGAVYCRVRDSGFSAICTVPSICNTFALWCIQYAKYLRCGVKGSVQACC